MIKIKSPNTEKPANNTNPNIVYLAGGAAGSGGALALNEIKAARASSKLTKALMGTSEKFDTFVSGKGEKLINKAAKSKKGFFGKLNSLKGDSDAHNKIGSIIDEYAEKAAKMAGSKCPKEKQESIINKLTSKLIKKDIKKSLNGSIAKKCAIALTGAAIGTGLILAGKIFFKNNEDKKN